MDSLHHPVTEARDFQIARQIIAHQLAADGKSLLAEPALQYWQQGNDNIGGNLLLAGRSPSGALHVLLASAGMRGLAGYLSLQPVVAPFQRMTERGFTLSAIARELNNKVRQSLPPGRVVAAQMAELDARTGIANLWNGGMPPAFMLDASGHLFQEFPLAHAALGALDDDAFDDRVEMYVFAQDDQLIMFSAGLLAAKSQAGVRFGEQGLADALVGVPQSLRRDEVAASLQAHLSGTEADDDITLVLVDCEKSASEISLPSPDTLQTDPAGNWCFSLRLAAGELRHVDVVPLLLGVTEQFPAARACSGELFVVLAELFNNALDHGLLRLDSRVKHSPDGMETWLLLREERLAALAEGAISLQVEQFTDQGRAWLRIRCADSGAGFDLEASLDAARSRLAGAHPCSLPSGRGLALVESIAHTVETSPQGNEITVLLALDAGAALAP
jgi:hypothetical protein